MQPLGPLRGRSSALWACSLISLALLTTSILKVRLLLHYSGYCCHGLYASPPRICSWSCPSTSPRRFLGRLGLEVGRRLGLRVGLRVGDLEGLKQQ